ncbi:MAG: ABC transporter permease [Candidatus Aminicenantes bacterium]|nr:MAG: ABC transporter permease [Candidatus Aminicenantes bacterium]
MGSRTDTIPGLGKALLWLLLDEEDYHQVVGDFEESYRYRIKTQGKTRAILWFWFILFKSLPGFIWDSIYWRGIMIKNYFKIALRIIKRQKLYSFLNIVGLAVSLTCSFLIFLHVRNELSYETNFPKANRLYRIQTNSKYGSTFRNWGASAPALGPILEETFPEVEKTVRIRDLGREILSYQPPQGTAKRFEERGGFISDSSIISMLDLQFLSGDPLTALEKPNMVVLTESIAKKYFADEDPIGKILLNENNKRPFQITGVIRDMPHNTHLKIDYLISMASFASIIGNAEMLNHRTWKAVYTYVLLHPDQTADSFDAKVPGFMKSFHADYPGRQEEILLQPIRKIHLHSKLEGEIGANSDIAYVYIFSGTALLLLLIAAVNFVNLSTAQSFKRMKEIGIRKVVGARRGQVIKQYLGESLLITALSAGFTLILLYLLLPFYTQMTGKEIAFGNIVHAQNILFLLCMMGFLSLLAGFYPAFFASGFQPVNTLKTIRDPRSSTTRLRKGLVIFQFVISIFMIFSTITIYRQLVFFHNQDLGFDKDKLVALRLYGEFRRDILSNTDALKTEILRHSAVSHVALSSNLPGSSMSNERLTPVSVADKSSLPMLRFMRVDKDFIEAAGLEIVLGRNFDRASDQKGAYIIAESVAEVLHLEQPLGVECRSDVHGEVEPIVGVIKDFHFASLHNRIEPLVLEYRPNWTGYLLVKVESGRSGEVIEFLRQKFDEVAPDHLFSYVFLDEYFNRNYEIENRSYSLFRIFSMIALLVACLGLFGLTVYAAEIRVKEIGIRKVLGASVPSITVLMSKEFILWVIIANLIAWPAAYLAMNRWLANFAFRVHIHAWTFAFSAASVILFALVTVSYQAIRAAVSNPVASLRYE